MAIGEYFRREHTTVLHAVKRVEADPELRARAEVAIPRGCEEKRASLQAFSS
jgi:hypothetical protein